MLGAFLGNLIYLYENWGGSLPLDRPVWLSLEFSPAFFWELDYCVGRGGQRVLRDDTEAEAYQRNWSDYSGHRGGKNTGFSDFFLERLVDIDDTAYL